MAKPVAPAPVQTPSVSGDRFSATWERWIKTLSDFAVDAGSRKTSGNLSYTVVGCLARVEYNGPGGEDVVLPLAPSGTLWVDALVSGAWTKLPAVAGADGKFVVTAPAGAGHFSATYLASIKGAA